MAVRLDFSPNKTNKTMNNLDIILKGQIKVLDEIAKLTGQPTLKEMLGNPEHDCHLDPLGQGACDDPIHGND